jgi:undecaprenyl-diphosphatase
MNAKTDTTIYDGHRGWYIASLIIALLALGAATMLAVQSKHNLPSWEVSTFHHINNWPASFKMTGLAITIIGGSVWAALASIAIATVTRFYRLAWRLAAVIIGGYGVDFILKQLVDRGRPADFLADLHRYSVETGAGFPSGHTTVATVISLTLLPYLPKAWRWLPIAWIALVAMSRVYLGVHLPLDVIGGFLVGLFVVSLSRVLPQPLRVFLRLD